MLTLYMDSLAGPLCAEKEEIFLDVDPVTANRGRSLEFEDRLGYKQDCLREGG